MTRKTVFAKFVLQNGKEIKVQFGCDVFCVRNGSGVYVIRSTLLSYFRSTEKRMLENCTRTS